VSETAFLVPRESTDFSVSDIAGWAQRLFVHCGWDVRWVLGRRYAWCCVPQQMSSRGNYRGLEIPTENGIWGRWVGLKVRRRDVVEEGQLKPPVS